MTKPDNIQITTCPFLGLMDDSTSHMAFTSPENICYQCKPAVQITLEHQNDYCLDANHKNCPIYIYGAGKRMPVDLAYDASEDHQYAPMDKRVVWSGLILAGIFAAIILYYLISSNTAANSPQINSIQSIAAPENLPSASPITTPQVVTTSTPSPELSKPQPTLTPFPTLTSILPTSTLAATQVLAHSLDVPVGNGQLYLIHKVVNGENLPTLIETYQTSLEAILAVNTALVIPIRIDAIIIIPLKNKEPQGLPKLEPYQVKQNQISPEALAELLKTSPELFISLNGFDDGELLNNGDWVLVPR